MQEYYSGYAAFVEKFRKESEFQSKIIVDISGIIRELTALKEQYSINFAEVKRLLDTSTEEKPKMEAEFRLLSSRKWVAMNIPQIIDEHSKYCLLNKLMNAKPKLTTDRKSVV